MRKTASASGTSPTIPDHAGGPVIAVSSPPVASGVPVGDGEGPGEAPAPPIPVGVGLAAAAPVGDAARGVPAVGEGANGDTSVGEGPNVGLWVSSVAVGVALGAPSPSRSSIVPNATKPKTIVRSARPRKTRFNI